MARPWYAFYPADYGRDTGHLSLIEHGAYRALMDHYYATAAPLPCDVARLLRLCRAKMAAEKAAVRFILREFFTLEDDGYHHRRIDAEIAKAELVSERCSISGRLGAAKRRQMLGAGLATASADAPAQSQPSQSQPQPQSQEIYIGEGNDWFEEFWSAYPRRQARGAARKAFAHACESASPDVLIAAATAYAARRQGQDAKFTRMPAKWLEQECWLDDAAPQGAAPPDSAAMAGAWGGCAAPLVAEIGAAEFHAYFAQCQFVRGPPARIRVAAPFLRDLIARKFSNPLRRAYGDFALELAA